MTTYLTKIPKVGPSFDFFQRTTVTWSTFGTDGYNGDGYQPDAIIPFSTYGLMFVVESGILEVSFNGTSTHLYLDSSIAKVYTFENRVNSLIWFKAASGSPVVDLMAWGIR